MTFKVPSNHLPQNGKFHDSMILNQGFWRQSFPHHHQKHLTPKYVCCWLDLMVLEAFSNINVSMNL